MIVAAFYHSNISNMNLSDLLLSDLLDACKLTHVQVSDVCMQSLYTSGFVNMHVFCCGVLTLHVYIFIYKRHLLTYASYVYVNDAPVLNFTLPYLSKYLVVRF